jgi:hypothetical protein
VLALTNEIQVSSGAVGEEMVPASTLGFTGRVFLYHEGELPGSEQDQLREDAKRLGLALKIRGSDYATNRSMLEKPIPFLCRDSRGKSDVARPIAVALSAYGRIRSKRQYYDYFSRSLAPFRAILQFEDNIVRSR